MSRIAFGFLSGILIFAAKTTPAVSILEYGFWVVVLAVFYRLRARFPNLVLAIFAATGGFLWAALWVHFFVAGAPDEPYLDRPILVEGVISSLPEENENRTRFLFNIEKPFAAKVRLNRYGKNRPPSVPGDVWRLRVKLKPRSGLQNPNGFDYEKWLFANAIDATGYVRFSAENQKIGERHFSVSRLRYQLREKLDEALLKYPFGNIVTALIIGDRSRISPQIYQTFIDTGTIHLTVISGLHIGLIAGLLFWFFARIWRLCHRCCLKIPAPIFGAWFGIIGAFCYTLVGGFSIPTVRACIMAFVFLAGVILRRTEDKWRLYAIALLLVLAVQPLAVFQIGFWLSFGVVAVIIYALPILAHHRWAVKLAFLQIFISLLMLPFVALFFQFVSLSSPVANFLAVPVFSFVTIPAALGGGILYLLDFAFAGEILLGLANQSLEWLYPFLTYLQNSPLSDFHFSRPLPMLFLLALGFVLLLSPKALGVRFFAPFIVLPIFFYEPPPPAHGTVDVRIFDVGQGLAVAVQSQNHLLIFDTGAAYSSGFDIGSAIIQPYLIHHQQYQIDKIILSHGDSDHIGGLDTLVENFSVNEIITPDPEAIRHPAKPCIAGEKWRWDGVDFEILHPENKSRWRGNNVSCVLKITTRNHTMILPGDIEAEAERFLLQTRGEKLRADVVIVPHHGSRTSSTENFIRALSPKIAIISSGFKNRFQHPHETVINRYQTFGAQIFNTACAGQIRLILGADEGLKPSAYRIENPHFTMRQCPPQ